MSDFDLVVRGNIVDAEKTEIDGWRYGTARLPRAVGVLHPQHGKRLMRAGSGLSPAPLTVRYIQAVRQTRKGSAGHHGPRQRVVSR